MLRKLITGLAVARYLPRNPFAGEMLPLERMRLFHWILTYKPKIVLEVGTGVGGSTFYIAEALKSYGGELHTCDPIRRPPEQFLNRFRGTLHYYALRSDQLIERLASTRKVPDFVFFDGPEIPTLALEDLKRTEPLIGDGCHFAMHDWEQAGSVKAQLVRPYMESSQKWKPIEVLHGHRKNVWWTKGTVDSVGLCLYRYQASHSLVGLAA